MKTAVSTALLMASPVVVAAADFFFGTATAAYQIEGFRKADGRQPSIWDAFDTGNASVLVPGVGPLGKPNVYNGENGEIADLDYVSYPQTAFLLKDYGFEAYRLSLSWTRIMSYSLVNCEGPNAKTTCQVKFTGVNQAGIDHYTKILTTLKQASVRASVTMWHWDTPLALEEWAIITQCSETNPHVEEQTGSAWLCPAISDFFAAYAQVCLTAFDSLVDYWVTLNEPLTVVQVGYAGPGHAPGRCKDRSKCWNGDESIEPYYAVKNMMLAHAKALRLEGAPVSKMGFAANGDWKEPISSCIADQQAAVNAMVWQMSLFWDLLSTGDWSPEIKAKVPAPRLPVLRLDEIALLKGAHGSIYFQNFYTSGYVWATSDVVSADCAQPNADWREAATTPGYGTDGRYKGDSKNPLTGASIGALAPGSAWLYFTPVGFPKMQRWLNHRYQALNLSFIVTENGWGGSYATKDQAVNDIQRCEYYKQYIGNMSSFPGLDYGPNSPIQLSLDRANVIGYFAWSLMDNYEWGDGYSQRFGITYVEYCGTRNDQTCNQTRIPKLSATWFSHVLKLPQFKSLDLSTWGPMPPCQWYTL